MYWAGTDRQCLERPTLLHTYNSNNSIQPDPDTTTDVCMLRQINDVAFLFLLNFGRDFLTRGCRPIFCCCFVLAFLLSFCNVGRGVVHWGLHLFFVKVVSVGGGKKSSSSSSHPEKAKTMVGVPLTSYLYRTT